MSSRRDAIQAGAKPLGFQPWVMIVTHAARTPTGNNSALASKQA